MKHFNIQNKQRFVLAALIFVLISVPSIYAQEDVTPPVLVEFSFTPTTVDVTAGSADVTVTARITDDLSGFGGGGFLFRSPSGQQSAGLNFGSGNRISGDENDGIYEFPITITQYAEFGTWVAYQFYLPDLASNVSVLFTGDLITGGFPTELSVVSVEDVTPPVLAEFSFTPTTVNVTAGSVDVTVTARITDDLSGFSGGGVIFQSPSGQQSAGLNFGSGNRISGDDNDGIYEFPITITQYAEFGTWVAYQFYLPDLASNVSVLYTDDLITAGFPTELSVVSVEDVTPPVLVEFSFTPTTVDVTAGSADVTVTARITDDLSGFGGGGFLFRSPSGQQSAGLNFGSGNRISGDENDGIYEFPITITQYAEFGTWVAYQFYLPDLASNVSVLFTGDLITGGFPTELSVVSVEDVAANELPVAFTLAQNYPNPFNPGTKIKYSVPQSSNVVIKVFDVLGNEIETLINEEKPVGTYELNWNAANLLSGVYFYRLQAGDFVQTRKMLLLK